MLYATRDVRATLANCRRLLKPGSNLILNESTNPDDLLSFVFGLLPGWWASEDGRQNEPLLSPSQWDKSLRDAGFSGTDATVSDGDEAQGHRMSVMVSTKPHQEEVASSKDIVVVITDDSSGFIGSLASSICG